MSIDGHLSFVIPAHFADVPDGNKSHLEEPVIAVNSYTEYTHGLVSVGVFYGTVCLGDMKISLAFMGKMFYYKQCE
jgi:hypothetical protein